MKKSFVLFGLLTVLNIVWGMPTWENGMYIKCVLIQFFFMIKL